MKKNEINMTEGPILRNLLLVSVPIILSGFLQLLYNASDMIVVGNFAEEGSLGAVGATASLMSMITNMLMGFSTGGSVVIGRYYGEKDDDGIHRALHTTLTLAFIGGCIFGIFGFCMARPLLQLMDTLPEFIDRSTLYMRIIFIGFPFNALYNFGSGVMRAYGDTRRPLYFLTVAGLINVVLNLILVIVFHLGVAGVAIATIASQAISALCVLICLAKNKGSFHFSLRDCMIAPSELKKITVVGLPVSIQGSLFSLSNMLIMSSINSFQIPAIVDGNTAASNLENFIYIAMNSISVGTLSFISQNYGARDFKRIRRALKESALLSMSVSITMGIVFYLCSQGLLRLYNQNPDVIFYGRIRMSIICTTYFLCGLMDLVSNALCGIGRSPVAMAVSLTGICLLRTVWVYTVFRSNHTLQILYLSYPVSWIISGLAHLGLFAVALHREIRIDALAAERENGRADAELLPQAGKH